MMIVLVLLLILVGGALMYFIGIYNGVGGSTAGNGIKIYLNGVEETLTVTNKAAYVAMENTAQPFEIGRYTTNYFDGNIDEVAIFDSELDATQVSDIYNSGEPTTITGATAYWKLGEQATFSTNWTVPDQVGSNDGTSANMTIEDRIGDAPNSNNNAVSFNMEAGDIDSDTP